MAAPDLQPAVSDCAFPSPSKQTSGLINSVQTQVQCLTFTDKILITISQSGKLSHWVHVPLSLNSADPMNPGIQSSSSENSLLPMTHLTATTILGGTKAEDEVVGQTLATTIGSALLMRNPGEERLLVVGMGIDKAAENFTGRAQFDEVVGLVLEVLCAARQLSSTVEHSHSDHVRPHWLAPTRTKASVEEISRPKNAFMIYRLDLHATIAAQNPRMHNNDISKIIGVRWRVEKPHVIEAYKKRAEEEKRQHAIDHQP
ncbi:Mating-type protein a-1 [Pseudocercospora fuligena]|uniref:Mating-type protein a-1 n=1 Tax=Pseudocercospora fuligena TaxID=685502 RepID=A0A8H6R8G3_9PEZI|nr:Mating-type protein a-1 [Pseudocercospora fuligena]